MCPAPRTAHQRNPWCAKSTGVNQTVSMLTFKGLDKTPGADYGKPHYALTLPGNNAAPAPFLPDNILSRYQIQFGARYTF